MTRIVMFLAAASLSIIAVACGGGNPSIACEDSSTGTNICYVYSYAGVTSSICGAEASVTTCPTSAALGTCASGTAGSAGSYSETFYSGGSAMYTASEAMTACTGTWTAAK